MTDRFFRKIIQPSEKEDNSLTIQTAALILLREVAGADDHFSAEERTIINRLLHQEYGLDEKKAEALQAAAREERQKSTDLYRFTKLINDTFNRAEKIHLVELFWELIYSDNQLSAHEDRLVHDLASLLGLDHHELIEAKLAVRERKDKTRGEAAP